MSLVNLDNLQAQITLSEVDIAKIQADKQVTLSLDALSGQSVSGKVVSVSPVGTVTSGVVNYTVTVALTKSDPAIKPGMTATASFIVAQRDNVLLVPNRALKTQNSRRYLTLLFEGKEIPLVVQTGLNNEQNTEIVSAATTDGQARTLAEGDVVVLNSTTTTSNAGGGGFGIPLGGGPPL
jgi:HlyD family secretion protein